MKKKKLERDNFSNLLIKRTLKSAKLYKQTNYIIIFITIIIFIVIITIIIVVVL